MRILSHFIIARAAPSAFINFTSNSKVRLQDLDLAVMLLTDQACISEYLAASVHSRIVHAHTPRDGR